VTANTVLAEAEALELAVVRAGLLRVRLPGVRALGWAALANALGFLAFEFGKEAVGASAGGEEGEGGDGA
jgi:hypothetical protein